MCLFFRYIDNRVWYVEGLIKHAQGLMEIVGPETAQLSQVIFNHPTFGFKRMMDKHRIDLQKQLIQVQKYVDVHSQIPFYDHDKIRNLIKSADSFEALTDEFLEQYDKLEKMVLEYPEELKDKTIKQYENSDIKVVQVPLEGRDIPGPSNK